MKLLIVGGSGYVGRIVCPSLESEHACAYYDIRQADYTACPMIVADVNDDEQVAMAVRDIEGVIYMPMGTVRGDRKSAHQTDPAFDVNVKGLYRFLVQAFSAGVRWFGYVSSLSVYQCLMADRPWRLRESDPADSLEPYGMSKRVGEFLCEEFAQANPESTVMSLRLCNPVDDEQWMQWLGSHRVVSTRRKVPPLAPMALRELFLAALHVRDPGYHVIHVSGDQNESHFDGSKARQLLNLKAHLKAMPPTALGPPKR